MRRVVDSWAVIHDVFGCLFSNSAFSADGVYCAPYFVRPVLELRVVATSQTPIILCSFLGNFDSSLRSSFSPFMQYTWQILSLEISPSGSTPDGGICRVVVVSDVFLIGCSSFMGLFLCHLIPHYLAVAWTSGDGYLVPFIIEGSKEV